MTDFDKKYQEAVREAKENVKSPKDIQYPDLDSNLAPIKTHVSLKFNFEIDFEFWAITPALNINLHSRTFEIEWLCFAIYIDKHEN